MVRQRTPKDPTILVVSGGQDLLRRRFLQEVCAGKKAEGWSVEYVDGSNPISLRDVLDGGIMVTGQVLTVVANPNKVKLAVLEAHLKEKDPLVTLLLHIEGKADSRTKFGKFVGKLKTSHKKFPKPKEWDAPKVAAAFVVSEVKRRGKVLDSKLAAALVQRVGSDLGMLSFEVEKMVTLAGDSPTVEAIHVKGAMAPIAEAAVGPIKEALELRQAKKLIRALNRLKQTSKNDPTMRICGFLGKSVMQWMQAAYLDALPPKEAAEELGLNAWYFERQILPASKRWGKKGTTALVRGLAASERAVKNGAISPWTVLTARLLSACTGPLR